MRWVSRFRTGQAAPGSSCGRSVRPRDSGPSATIASGDNVSRIWADATHERLYYGVYKADFSAEWHRVDFDGTDDQMIGTAPVGVVLSDSVLAIDDSAFVVDWCPA